MLAKIVSIQEFLLSEKNFYSHCLLYMKRWKKSEKNLVFLIYNLTIKENIPAKVNQLKIYFFNKNQLFIMSITLKWTEIFDEWEQISIFRAFGCSSDIQWISEVNFSETEKYQSILNWSNKIIFLLWEKQTKRQNVMYSTKIT